MKRFVCLLAMVGMVLGSLLGMPQRAIAANLAPATLTSWFSAPNLVAVEELRSVIEEKLQSEFGQKLDLNNTNVRAFREIQGMYPTLAAIVVKNAPYDRVDDVLDISGLTDTQKETLKDNLDKFTVTDAENALVEGGDRINNGIYR